MKAQIHERVKVSTLDLLTATVHHYLRSNPPSVQSVISRIDRKVVRDVIFGGFRPEATIPEYTGFIQAYCHDGRAVIVPIRLTLLDIEDVNNDPSVLYGLIETAVINALEAVNALIYEDPFVTWAKEVRRDAGVS